MRVSENTAIEKSCYWLDSRQSYEVSPPLDGDLKVDIVVVGAGFTGLWTAYFLKQLDPHADVAVVEQRLCGYGASGRNAGMVSFCVDHTHALAVSHFGADEAARLSKIGIRNIDEMQEFASGCDFERSGQLHAALTPAHLAACEEDLATARELGIGGYKLLSAEEIRQELNSPLYLGGLSVPGAILNPIKLVDKIKIESQKLGVQFYENTAVIKVDGNCVRTPRGTITARKVILATDAYTHHLFPELLAHYIPLYDYILVSRPLEEDELKSIGWQHRQGVTDCRTFFNYYRLTADNRILWGTSEAMYYPPNRVDESCDHSASHYKTLKESFKRHFPQLDGLEFPYSWGGPIASTTRLTPFFGTLENGCVTYGLGYTGHGIASTRLAGKILAHLTLEKNSELLELKMVKHKPFPYPPEPLRTLSVKAVTHSLRQVDAGKNANILLRLLDSCGLGFSS